METHEQLEYIGHGVLWLGVGGVGLVYLWVTHDTSLAAFVLALKFYVGLLLDVVNVGVVKTLVQRPRPSYDRGHIIATPRADRFSFPSGHTSRASFTLVFVLLEKVGGWPLALLVFVWLLLLGTSRFTMGRHYASDVVAGVLLGWIDYATLLFLMWLPTSPDFQWWVGRVNGYPAEMPTGEIVYV